MQGSDFDQLWFGARAMLRGADPYTLIGPGREVPSPWPLYFPGTALVLAVPFTLLSLPLAQATFVFVSTGVLALACTKDGYWGLGMFLSGSLLNAVTLAEWSPLFTAALFWPPLAALWAAKPTAGLVPMVAQRRVRGFLVAAVSGVLLVAISLLLFPSWPVSWWHAVRGDANHRPLILRPWGFVVLLALFRWRLRETRILLALACAPITTTGYEMLPLFAIPKNRMEILTLAALSQALRYVLAGMVAPGGSFEAYVTAFGRLHLWMMFVPCAVMLLRRENTPRKAHSLR